MHLKLAILPPPFFLTLDYSVVHKIVAIIPAEFDFNMFIKFHTYISTYTKNPQAFVFLHIKQALKSSNSLSLFGTKGKIWMKKNPGVQKQDIRNTVQRCSDFSSRFSFDLDW